MKEIKIGSNDANQRLDKFLQKTFPNLSKSMMYKAIRNKKIKVNRKRCEFNQILQKEDIVLLFLPEDVLIQKNEVSIQNFGPIDILYEDEHILIVDKPRGLLSQSNAKNQDCLVSRIQYYLYKTHQFDPEQEYSFRPTICHRLDRNTTGLVIAAKNAHALKVMNQAIKERVIRKFYMAKVEGHLTSQHLHLYLKKDKTKALVSNQKLEGYQDAIMDVKALRKDGKNTWCEIELLTGRFHQIRALLSFIGHPLVSDVKYGGFPTEKGYQLTAYKLDLSKVNLPLKQKVFTSELLEG